MGDEIESIKRIVDAEQLRRSETHQAAESAQTRLYGYMAVGNLSDERLDAMGGIYKTIRSSGLYNPKTISPFAVKD